jgi:hypothetical protein
MPEFRPVPLNGLTELRIHGVSGTPTESMLSHPHPVQVSGDKVAGFYRRGEDHVDHLDRGDRSVGGGGERHVEAYTWGRLTSGVASRALWLLLLPFTLVNVATWAHPVLSGTAAPSGAGSSPPR